MSRIYDLFFLVFIESENLLDQFLTLNPSERHVRGNHEGPMDTRGPEEGLEPPDYWRTRQTESVLCLGYTWESVQDALMGLSVTK